MTMKLFNKSNIPKSVLEFLPFKDVWNNYIFLDNDRIIGAVKIGSINLSLLFDREQEIKVLQLKKALNSIDYPYKIFSIDKQIDLDNSLNLLGSKIKLESNKNKRKLLEEDYNHMSFLKDTKSVVNREFYIFIEEDSNNENLMRQKLSDLIQLFSGVGLNCNQVMSEDLRNLLFILLNPISSLDTFKNDATTITKSFKERIAPKGLKFGEKDINLGDAYVSVCTLISYPSLVDIGWLGAVANIQNTRMTINVSPLNSQEISSTLKKSMSEVKSKIINVNDYNDQILLNNKLQDYTELVNRIDREHERFVMLTVNFLCYAETKEELNKVKKELKNTLSAYGLSGTDLMFEQERSFKMCLPNMYQDLEKQYGLPIPMMTLASSFPFIFQNLQDDGDSIMLGYDSLGSPLFFDIWKRDSKRNNSNALIVGQSGKGKSTLVKKIARGNWCRGNKIIIIDPEREYKDICEQVGGAWIDCGTGTSGIINPLEIRPSISEDEDGAFNNDLSRHIQTFRTFIKYYLQDLTAYEMTKIEEVLLEVYEDKGINFETDLSKFTSANYPIMEDLYKKLRKKLDTAKKEKDAKNVIESLEKVCSLIKRATIGADAKIFNGISSINVDKDADFIVLDIHSLIDSDDTILKTQFFNILSWCWYEISKNRNERVILICDEAHLIIDPKNPDGMDFLKRTVKRIRKYNGSFITISQNFIDFTAEGLERFGQVIIDNSAYIIVMAQGQKEIEAVQKMLKLSESETEFLSTAEKGQALFIISQDTRIPIEVQLREEEKILFGSGGGR